MTNKPELTVKIFDDLFCIVVAETGEYDINFTIYEFQYGGIGGQKPTVEELSRSDQIAKGYVKWDGCSEWDVEGWHACSKKQLKDMSEIFSRCWDMASELCPNWGADE